ncbi:MAG: hypothetical protein EXR48_07605 [Dehalococcoidia bacterium]|nr:hypothetical protein [Dehalococcoidia bacterium]
MPRGDIVLARTALGQPIVRRVWQVSDTEVHVAHEDYYVRWEQYKVDPWTFALERSNVFQHDEALFQALERAYARVRQKAGGAEAEMERLWKTARPYGG